jgi:hypothetical protein
VRRYRGQRVESFTGAVFEHQFVALGVDRLERAVGMKNDAALLE